MALIIVRCRRDTDYWNLLYKNLSYPVKYLSLSTSLSQVTVNTLVHVVYGTGAECNEDSHLNKCYFMVIN